MVNDLTQALYFGAGALYFALAFYFAFKNYRTTKHDGFWFFTALFSLVMTGAMVAGSLWNAEIVSEDALHAYHDMLFLIAAIMLFVAAYTLHKEHHKIKVF